MSNGTLPLPKVTITVEVSGKMNVKTSNPNIPVIRKV